MTFVRTDNDVVVCDLDVELSSDVAYTGTCVGCAFAFDVTATVSRDASTIACVRDREFLQMTLQAGDVDLSTINGELTEPWLAFTGEISTDVYNVPPFPYYLKFYDTLLFGATYLSDDGTPHADPSLTRVYGEHAMIVPAFYGYGPYTYGPFTNPDAAASFDGHDGTFSFATARFDTPSHLLETTVTGSVSVP